MVSKILRIGIAGIAVFSFSAVDSHHAQTQRQKKEAVQLGVTLVRIDASVTDKEGKPVEGLTPANFEIIDNGKRQSVLHTDYVRLGARAGNSPPRSGHEGARIDRKLEDEIPGISRDHVRRVVALVVDDIRISAAELPMMRDLLTHFVDHEMEDGDLVAIIRTDRGSGIFQQFTNDRNLLRRSIDQIRNSRVNDMFYDEKYGVEQGASSASDQITPRISRRASGFTNSGLDETDPQPVSGSALWTAQGLETINYAVGSLSQLPGRKAIVFISRGFSTFGIGSSRQNGRSGNEELIDHILRALTDAALRAGVVIHTVDFLGLRGTPARLFDSGIGSLSDELGAFGHLPEFSGANDLPLGSEYLRESGLTRLAGETGGIAIVNTNDLKTGIERISRTMNDYYVLTYAPEDLKLDGRFHQIAVKVKGVDGAVVRTRDGYFALAGEKQNEHGFGSSISAEAPENADEVQRLFHQMMSPLVARQLRLQPALYFRKEKGGGVFVQALLYIPGEDVSFRPQDRGQVTSLDAAVFFFNERGEVTGQFARRINYGLTPESYEDARRRGIVISGRVTLPPGFYQFRAVVRDNLASRFGSASQSLEIPDPGGSQLQITPITFSSQSSEQIRDRKEAVREAELMLARRRFARQGTLEFLAQVFGARQQGKSGQPPLTQRITLFKEQNKEFEGPATPVRFPPQPEPGIAYAAGRIELSYLTPGRYVLKLTVTDMRGRKGKNTATQFAGFTVQ